MYFKKMFQIDEKIKRLTNDQTVTKFKINKVQKLSPKCKWYGWTHWSFFSYHGTMVPK